MIFISKEDAKILHKLQVRFFKMLKFQHIKDRLDERY
jgi:hypothetical protein